MASGFTGGNGMPEFYGVGGGEPEFYGVDGRSVINNPQPIYRNQIPGIFLDQIGNRAVSGKRTLADFQAAQQQQSFHNQAAINAFLLRSVRSRSFQNLQSPTIDLTNVNDMSFLGGSSQRYGVPYLRSQSDFGNRMLTGFPCVEPVQNLNRVQESETMVKSLRELEKQLLDDDDESDDVSVITNSNSDWLNSFLTPISNPNPNPVLSSSPSSSSSSSSPSTASTTTTSVLCTRQTVMEIAAAIAEGKIEIASEILSRVSQTRNPKRSSEEKLVDFMVTALRWRINPAESSGSKLYGKEHLISTQLLYELSPCFKLGFMAANLAILDAVNNNNDEVTIHVIDFDIGEGGQYVNLLHALSTRRNSNKPPVVKITAVVNNSNGIAVAGDDVELRLKSVGDMLSQLSNRLGIYLIFDVVLSPKLCDLNRESLKCDPNEPLAVNLAFKLYRVPDESVCTENPRDELLRRIKGLNPRVVTLVEQEMNSNTAPFLSRVNESCAIYGSLLDSVESTVPNSNPDRAKVEEGIGRKLINTVACEGIDRIERCEVFGKWRMRMSMAGFELMPVSEKIAEAMKCRLSNGNGNRVHPGFTVKEDDGGVCFGWMGRTLAVASAWC